MMRRLAAVTVVVALVAIGSWALAQTPPGKAWIDQPLSRLVITSVPVTVTAHATHPDGVAEARLDVDGETVVQQGTVGETLVTVEFTWTPPGSGTYLLEVYGSGGGGWGTPGSVEVVVDLGDGTTTTIPEEPTTTTTAAATTTTTTRPATTTTAATTTTTTTAATTTTTTAPPTTTTTAAPTTTTTTTVATTTTSAPTTTTTTCSLGVPSPTGPRGTVSTLSPTLSWSYSGCEPTHFEVEVSRDFGVPRLEWSGTTPGGSRSIGVSVGADCTTYYWRIRTIDGRTIGPWSSVATFRVEAGRC